MSGRVTLRLVFQGLWNLTHIGSSPVSGPTYSISSLCSPPSPTPGFITLTISLSLGPTQVHSALRFLHLVSSLSRKFFLQLSLPFCESWLNYAFLERPPWLLYLKLWPWYPSPCSGHTAQCSLLLHFPRWPLSPSGMIWHLLIYGLTNRLCPRKVSSLRERFCFPHCDISNAFNSV